MNKDNKEPGYVYILTNQSFKDDWVKIGKSSRPVDVRSKELDNTAVPLPFEIFATLKTSKYNEVERHIHKMIDRLTDLRIRQNREFFNISPQGALELLKDSARLLDDAEIFIYKDGKPYLFDENSPTDNTNTGSASRDDKRTPFNFSLVNIPVGAELTFIPTGVTVRVADDKRVEYEDRLYSLSAFTGTFIPEDKRNTSGAYQGPKYFSYKGETLTDIRSRLEKRGE